MSERELQHVSNQVSLMAYLAEIKQRREYVLHAPLSSLRTANMDTALGNLWFLVNPALSIGTYVLIFGVLLDVNRGVSNYIGYLVVGVTVFNMLTQTAMKASRSLVQNESLIRSLYFPRAIIPLSSALEGLYTFGFSILVMFGAVLVSGAGVSWRSLMAIPALALCLLFMCGLVFVSSRIGGRFRDLASLLPHLSRLFFYASGVLYLPSAITDNQSVLRFFDLNPFYLAMALPRWALLGTPLEPSSWLVFSAWTAFVLIGGFIFFWRGEARYGT